jgi:hypothetical protein
MFENIPLELKSYKQWVVWRLEETQDGKATKIPYNAFTGGLAKVDEPNTWCSFDDAVNSLKSGLFSGIGFVLTPSDPFAFVDLDNPYERKADGTFKYKDPDGTFKRQQEIFNSFKSYAEFSPSGNGLHIICKGLLPTGRKRGGIELYSSLRFMTMTGNVYRNAPVLDENELLNSLYVEMTKGDSVALTYFGLAEETETDEEILERMWKAENGEKAYQLWVGNWQDYYHSQSEADLALVNIIAFYTQATTQIVRLFRKSGLGEREKAKRNDYIKFMLNKCFDNMLPPVDISGLQNQLAKALELKKKQTEKLAENKPVELEISADLKAEYSLPPGLVGEIAQFIYAAAPRPCAPIALVGALGLVAGIAGRAYNISGTGLDQHFIAVADTGIGKDAIKKGYDKLMKEVCKIVPAAADFIGPAKIASESAILKFMSAGKNSIVCTVGEFGYALQEMSDPRAPANKIELMKFLLYIYNQSAKDSLIQPTIYSDKVNNTAIIQSPNFCMVGDTTPETFYGGLSEKQIKDGFLPRLNIFEYRGKRPHLNEGFHLVQPDARLVEKVATLCSNSLMLNSQNEVILIQTTPEAELRLKEFDRFCDDCVNSANRDAKRQLWSRAHLKVIKMAGLISVGINPWQPTVTDKIAAWAQNIVLQDVRNILNRIDSGEMSFDGSSDEIIQLQQMLKVIKDYITMSWHDVKKYAGDSAMPLYSAKIIPYSYIQRRLVSVAAFRKDKLGSANALKRALKTLTERGDLQEMGRGSLMKDYGTSALCYMVKNVDFILSAQ